MRTAVALDESREGGEMSEDELYARGLTDREVREYREAYRAELGGRT
jgi:hypothetical protein